MRTLSATVTRSFPPRVLMSTRRTALRLESAAPSTLNCKRPPPLGCGATVTVLLKLSAFTVTMPLSSLKYTENMSLRPHTSIREACHFLPHTSIREAQCCELDPPVRSRAFVVAHDMSFLLRSQKIVKKPQTKIPAGNRQKTAHTSFLNRKPILRMTGLPRAHYPCHAQSSQQNILQYCYFLSISYAGNAG